MMRFLIISVFALIGLNSCKPFHLEGQQSTSIQDTVYNNYFSDYQQETLYRGRIDVYGKVITGLFVAKRINEDEHRMVFTSDFGNTLFDFTIKPGAFQVNYIMDELDRKFIVNILKKDFTTLVQIANPVNRRVDKGTVWGFESVFEQKYLLVDKETGQLNKIGIFSKYKPKVDFEFIRDKSNQLSAIEIVHHNIKLQIKLSI